MKGFYELSKQERIQVTNAVYNNIANGIKANNTSSFIAHFADEDTYIRKAAYQATGQIYFKHPALQAKIIRALNSLLTHQQFKVRQTVINAAGEIGKTDFKTVQHFFDKGLFDEHHSPRNAVIGSIKKMGEVNPAPVIEWARHYLHHPDKEIRREICHGIELRGRKHPEDILPLLKELQFDKTARVRNTLVHVLGQIAYKKGCLAIVIADLKKWDNKELVTDAIEEIIDVHHRYRDFAVMTQAEAKRYIDENL